MPKPVINPIVKPIKAFKAKASKRTPKQTSHLFKKGWKGGPGRPKGSIDKAVLEVRKFSQKLFTGLFRNKKYLQALEDRIMRGKESPQVMALLLAYGFGRPPEKITIEDPDGVLGGGGQIRRDELVKQLCNRFAAIVAQGHPGGNPQPALDGGAGGPVLELEGRCETEPDPTGGRVDDLVDSGGQRLGESTRPEHANTDAERLDHDGGNPDG